MTAFEVKGISVPKHTEKKSIDLGIQREEKHGFPLCHHLMMRAQPQEQFHREWKITVELEVFTHVHI